MKVKLEFLKDCYYDGKLLYQKGIHEVDTENGWADRWVRRGAIKLEEIAPKTDAKSVGKPKKKLKQEGPDVTNHETTISDQDLI